MKAAMAEGDFRALAKSSAGLGNRKGSKCCQRWGWAAPSQCPLLVPRAVSWGVAWLSLQIGTCHFCSSLGMVLQKDS